ncbi:MAG: energy transducer TonB [Desulfatiglandales bacterium]
MMAAGIENTDSSRQIRWGSMVALSVCFHVAIFSLFLFFPNALPHRRSFEGTVYQVDLVEMPVRGIQKPASTKPVETTKSETASKTDTMAKRIAPPAQKTKPLVIAKRTLDKKPVPAKEATKSTSQMIENAISKIERKVRSDQPSQASHVETAISRLEKRVGAQEQAGGDGHGSQGGVPMQIYRMEVESWIKSNWAYPVAMGESKDLEAIVVLRVNAAGAVLKTHFLRRSNNDLFDQSVLKAIERSDPLPPFPETYRKSYEDFEIKFNLSELNRL